MIENTIRFGRHVALKFVQKMSVQTYQLTMNKIARILNIA